MIQERAFKFVEEVRRGARGEKGLGGERAARWCGGEGEDGRENQLVLTFVQLLSTHDNYNDNSEPTHYISRLPARHCPLPSHTITARPPPPQLLHARPLPLLPLHPLRPQPLHLCPFLLLELPQQLLLLVLHEVFANPRLHLLDPGVTVLVVLVLGVELLPRPVSLVLLLRLPLLLLLHFDYLLRHSAVALRALDHVVQRAVVPVPALLLDCPLLLRVPRHVPLLGVGA